QTPGFRSRQRRIREGVARNAAQEINLVPTRTALVEYSVDQHLQRTRIARLPRYAVDACGIAGVLVRIDGVAHAHERGLQFLLLAATHHRFGQRCRDTGKQPDDGHGDHQLDQRETGLRATHDQGSTTASSRGLGRAADWILLPGPMPENTTTLIGAAWFTATPFTRSCRSAPSPVMPTRPVRASPMKTRPALSSVRAEKVVSLPSWRIRGPSVTSRMFTALGSKPI